MSQNSLSQISETFYQLISDSKGSILKSGEIVIGFLKKFKTRQPH
jgi:hypothetical protein